VSSRPTSTGESDPECTIVVLNYNYGRFVGEAIDSAIEQTCTATEVVVVDDGSTDESLSVIERYSGAVTAHSQSNAGQAAAINAAFRLSRGRVVIFLDADDTLEPTAAEVATEAMRPGVVQVHWPMTVVDAAGGPTGRLKPEWPLPDGDLRAVVRRDGPGAFGFAATSGNAFDREFLASVLPVPTVGYERGGADHYLAWIASACGVVRRIDAPLSRHRRHGGNDSLLGSLDEKIDQWMRESNDAFAVAAQRIGASGEDLLRWRTVDWAHRLDAARAVIRDAVPPGEAFALLDEQQWAARGTIGGRAVHQFAASGPPALGGEVVAELKEWLDRGVRYLVVVDSAGWWLGHYRELAAELDGSRLCAEAAGVRVYRIEAPSP
jgi:glycosyltransferase involved in cell wall biosynthesis